MEKEEREEVWKERKFGTRGSLLLGEKEGERRGEKRGKKKK